MILVARLLPFVRERLEIAIEIQHRLDRDDVPDLVQDESNRLALGRPRTADEQDVVAAECAVVHLDPALASLDVRDAASPLEGKRPQRPTLTPELDAPDSRELAVGEMRERPLERLALRRGPPARPAVEPPDAETLAQLRVARRCPL